MIFRRVKIALLIFFISPTMSFGADDALIYSLRVRPLGILTASPGAEVFLGTESGFFIGPTFATFSGDNDIKSTALQTTEIGLKFGRVFGGRTANQGWFVMGNINYYLTSVTQFYSGLSKSFQANIHQFGEAIFAGYQFQASLIGDRWDVRLGLGLAYKPGEVQYFQDGYGNTVPVGVLKRFDPSLEFTLGYSI